MFSSAGGVPEGQEPKALIMGTKVGRQDGNLGPFGSGGPVRTPP
jgi:hypothetical protein